MTSNPRFLLTYSSQYLYCKILCLLPFALLLCAMLTSKAGAQKTPSFIPDAKVKSHFRNQPIYNVAQSLIFSTKIPEKNPETTRNIVPSTRKDSLNSLMNSRDTTASLTSTSAHKSTTPDPLMSTSTSPGSLLTTPTTPDPLMSTSTSPGSLLTTPTTPDPLMSTSTSPGSLLTTPTTPDPLMSTSTSPGSLLTTPTTPGPRLTTSASPESLLTSVTVVIDNTTEPARYGNYSEQINGLPRKCQTLYEKAKDYGQTPDQFLTDIESIHNKTCPRTEDLYICLKRCEDSNGNKRDLHLARQVNWALLKFCRQRSVIRSIQICFHGKSCANDLNALSYAWTNFRDQPNHMTMSLLCKSQHDAIKCQEPIARETCSAETKTHKLSEWLKFLELYYNGLLSRFRPTNSRKPATCLELNDYLTVRQIENGAIIASFSKFSVMLSMMLFMTLFGRPYCSVIL